MTEYVLPVVFGEQPDDDWERWPASARNLVRVAMTRKSIQVGKPLSVVRTEVRAEGAGYVGRVVAA